MSIIIRRLIWEPTNIKHIATKHNVIPEEVEEVGKGYHLVRQALKKRLIMVGQTDTGRVLEIVLQAKGRGVYYPVTAYDASPPMKVTYLRRREANNNESPTKK